MAQGKKLASGRHLSAFKRQRQTSKRTLRNRTIRSSLKTEIKKLHADPSAEKLMKTTSRIAKTASKGIIPKRRASRLVSRLSRMVGRKEQAAQA